MAGFRGAPADFELVMYLAPFAIVFEKVVLDPHLPWDEGKPSEHNTLEQIEAIRRQAKLLQNQLPARVQMEMASSVRDVPNQKMYITTIMYERKRKERNNCKDIISLLTDDILVQILSLLDLSQNQCSLKEMEIRTSILLYTMEISCCCDCRKREIAARNLNSIVYYGHEEDVKFGYAPLLNEASVSGPNAVGFIHKLHHSGSLHQLAKLTALVPIQDFIWDPIGCPQFVNLKQLDFSFSDAADHTLLIFTNLIDACPVLHKFKLQRLFRKSYWFDDEEALRGNVIKVAEKHHHCLRIFERDGFREAPADSELVMSLARFALVFEKVVLDPRLPWDEGKPSEHNTLEQIEAIRRQAKLLQIPLPARVKVEVL
ncbi:hypothetical protein Cgig2_007363 [Carnegiea gigantea]|uniref:Uncharacterized protein n=1 Tax=Carnegiea gigantea TaxID=171969 RepID=A0A9Q1KXU1_9CARY|nr:hypothetical protein Cgig2_007363 [Carnegiea gigantea]